MGNGLVPSSTARAGTPHARDVAQVRGVLADRVVIRTQLDPSLPLRALAAYSGLSVHYRVGGKLLVRRSEFDTWIAVYRQRGRPDVDALVGAALKNL